MLSLTVLLVYGKRPAGQRRNHLAGPAGKAPAGRARQRPSWAVAALSQIVWLPQQSAGRAGAMADRARRWPNHLAGPAGLYSRWPSSIESNRT